MDSSFGNRKRLAAKYGIKYYRGTADQNVKLLNKLQGGKSRKPSKIKSFKPGQKVTVKKSASNLLQVSPLLALLKVTAIRLNR
nr:hypothetical protein [Virgibacillus proomii]